MPIALVAGTAGTVTTTRAVQVYNAIPQAERANWRIFYFDQNRLAQEYTRTGFDNRLTVALAAQTHCLIFGHGRYNPQAANLSTGLSYWDIDANTANFDTSVYTNWLTATGTGVTTVKIAACHAGDAGAADAATPIRQIRAVRPAMQAEGPTTTLLALGGVNVNWTPAAPAGWTRI